MGLQAGLVCICHELVPCLLLNTFAKATFDEVCRHAALSKPWQGNFCLHGAHALGEFLVDFVSSDSDMKSLARRSNIFDCEFEARMGVGRGGGGVIGHDGMRSCVYGAIALRM